MPNSTTDWPDSSRAKRMASLRRRRTGERPPAAVEPFGSNDSRGPVPLSSLRQDRRNLRRHLLDERLDLTLEREDHTSESDDQHAQNDAILRNGLTFLALEIFRFEREDLAEKDLDASEHPTYLPCRIGAAPRDAPCS